MLNYRSFSVALALIMVFCVSFAVMWRQRPAAPPAMADTAAAESLTVSPAVPLHTVAATAPDVLPVKHPAAVSPAPAPMAPANTEGPEMPVILSLSTRPRYMTEDGPAGEPVNVTKDVTEAILVNTSDQPLSLSVIEVDFQTHAVSQTQIVLAKNMQKHIGADQGLNMKPGDDITLRSPSYRDLTQQIP